jgi:hypothetical protein
MEVEIGRNVFKDHEGKRTTKFYGEQWRSNERL